MWLGRARQGLGEPRASASATEAEARISSGLARGAALSRAARTVRVVIRGEGLAATMSRYLVERIESRLNVEIITRTEVSAVDGDGRLEHADLRSRADGNVERVAVSAVFVMIGADPCTEAVHTMLALDEAGYISAATARRPARGRTVGVRPTGNRTCSRPSGWRLRRGRRPRRRDEAVAGAVGDEALAVRFAHQVLQV